MAKLGEFLPSWQATTATEDEQSATLALAPGLDLVPGASAVTVTEPPRSGVVTRVEGSTATVRFLRSATPASAPHPVEFGAPLWAVALNPMFAFKPGIGWSLGADIEAFTLSTGPLFGVRLAGTALAAQRGAHAEARAFGGLRFWLIPLRLGLWARVDLGAVNFTNAAGKTNGLFFGAALGGLKVRLSSVLFLDVFGGADLAFSAVAIPYSGAQMGLSFSFELDSLPDPR